MQQTMAAISIVVNMGLVYITASPYIVLVHGAEEKQGLTKHVHFRPHTD